MSRQNASQAEDTVIFLIIAGVIVAVGGGALATVQWPDDASGGGHGLLAFLGLAICGIGQAMAFVGIVACGVRLGINWSGIAETAGAIERRIVAATPTPGAGAVRTDPVRRSRGEDLSGIAPLDAEPRSHLDADGL